MKSSFRNGGRDVRPPRAAAYAAARAAAYAAANLSRLSFNEFKLASLECKLG